MAQVSRQRDYLDDKPSKVGDETSPSSHKRASMSESDGMSALQPVPCPIDDASLFSVSTVSWMTPLMKQGAKKPLKLVDLWAMPKKDRISVVYPQFKTSWDAEISTAQGSGKDPNILLAALRAFKKDVQDSALAMLLSVLGTCALPLLVERVLNFVSQPSDDEDRESIGTGLSYAFGMVGASLLSAIGLHQSFTMLTRLGVKIRGSLMTAVYAKALAISNASRQQSTVGEMVNLMSNDAERSFFSSIMIHWLWAGVLIILFGVYILISRIGVAGIAGFVVLCMMVPTQFFFSKVIGKYRSKMMQWADKRVKLLSEIFQGVKVIKLYNWEAAMVRYVGNTRREEIKRLGTQLLLKQTNLILSFVAPTVVALVSFSTYISLGNTLDVETTFTVMSALIVMILPLNILPIAVNFATEAKVASHRLRSFLLLAELSFERTVGERVYIKDGTFTWNEDSEPVLRDVNIDFPKGSLTVVVGTVGSGKSSLLAALMGELEKVSGDVGVVSGCAYTASSPWIQNATVEDNITFGNPLVRELYSRVLHVSALDHDLNMLPSGDQTEIGERGINLSGGQKARISLARALYRVNETELYLLDDPLSAVDTNVGSHIFEESIMGHLEGKTRVLVLNSHLQHLARADYIIVMENGMVAYNGKFEGLKQKFPQYVVKGETANEESEKSLAKATEGSQRESLMTEETKMEGTISVETVAAYFSAAFQSRHGRIIAASIFAVFLLGQMVRLSTDFWLSRLSEEAATNEDGTEKEIDHGFWLGIYGALVAAVVIIALLRSCLVIWTSLNASQRLHEDTLKAVLASPLMTFFEVTPVGRILNRFAKDQDQVDAMLPDMLSQFFQNSLLVLGVVIVVASSTLWFLAALVPIAAVFFFIQQYFRLSSREMKRIDAISRSPIFSDFSETLTGLSTLRAFNVSDRFRLMNEERVETNSRAFLAFWMAGRWLAVRLDLISLFIVGFVSIIGVSLRDTLGAGMVGLALAYSLQLTGLLQWTVRNFIEVENLLTSVERIVDYRDLPAEGSGRGEVRTGGSEQQQQVAECWPTDGVIEFKDVEMRYRPGLDLALKGLSFTTRRHEKIGICGRTGAGKSSISVVMFQLTDLAAGQIVIDGVDISTIMLPTLRSRLAIIPQDPVLFSGTMRFNLDPFHDHEDDSVWSALASCHMKRTVEELGGLTAAVAESGDNLSSGQRQLICIGRALLKESKIIVLDEATSSVDTETDALIQDTVRENFRDCTVLTIAHRLDTIIKSDRVLVMSDGRVTEFDEPSVLLSNKESVFYDLCQKAGIAGDVNQSK